MKNGDFPSLCKRLPEGRCPLNSHWLMKKDVFFSQSTLTKMMIDDDRWIWMGLTRSPAQTYFDQTDIIVSP